MCGIAGGFHYRDSEGAGHRDAACQVTRTFAHLGPDDGGFYGFPFRLSWSPAEASACRTD